MKHCLKIHILFICCIIFFTEACNSSDKKNTGKEEILSKPPFAAITDSIRQFPDQAQLYFERAQLLSQKNLHEIATADYKKSWELKPDELTAIQYASNLSITDKADEELQFLENCMQQFPRNREFKRIMGEAYIQSGKSKNALGLYDNILKNDPNDFEAWYEKGMLLANLKDTANAINAIKNAFAIQPTNTYALELAHLYAETKNAGALVLCDEVINRDSAQELIDPFFIKGIYYSNIKQYETAIVQFDSCIQRDWKFTEAYIEKGIAFFKQQNYDVAMNTFRMAATVSNTDPDAYFWIGRCYEAINKKDEAIQYYQRAVSLDKNFTEAKEAIRRLQG
jgi:tetratricopeptide (TPR) repeat protein